MLDSVYETSALAAYWNILLIFWTGFQYFLHSELKHHFHANQNILKDLASSSTEFQHFWIQYWNTVLLQIMRWKILWRSWIGFNIQYFSCKFALKDLANWIGLTSLARSHATQPYILIDYLKLFLFSFSSWFWILF